MDGGVITATGTWALLPPDLLLEILRRLESTAVIRCAATCKPWRRAIIGNASFLRPRLDRFVPNLLLGVFHGYGKYHHQHVYLRRTPGPFQSALPWTGSAAAGGESRIQSLIPATGGFDREMYTDLLSSRDGFILLKGRRWWSGVILLCNLMTGDCKILPDASIGSCTYVLLTGYDDSTSKGNADDHLSVRIVAIAGTDMMCTEANRITYQVFSFASGSGNGGAGAWGPVKHSVPLNTGFWVPVYDPCTVVSGDAVYWFGGPRGYSFSITCAVGLDVRTGRAWTTVLPKETQFWYYGGAILTPTRLATSGNGRLSLIQSLGTTTGHQIKVWVLTGNDQGSLQKRIDVQVQKVAPNYGKIPLLLNAFCPRSGCVVGSFASQEIIRIDLEGSSRLCFKLIGMSKECSCSNAYEMDWSTYVSKMKQF